MKEKKPIPFKEFILFCCFFFLLGFFASWFFIKEEFEEIPEITYQETPYKHRDCYEKSPFVRYEHGLMYLLKSHAAIVYLYNQRFILDKSEKNNQGDKVVGENIDNPIGEENN